MFDLQVGIYHLKYSFGLQHRLHKSLWAYNQLWIRKGKITSGLHSLFILTLHTGHLHTVSISANLKQPDSAVSCFPPSTLCNWKDYMFTLYYVSSEMLPLESKSLTRLAVFHIQKPLFYFCKMSTIYWCSI